MLTPTSVPEPAVGIRRLRVLVVEDDPLFRSTLVDLLSREGHTTAAAADGAEAWRMLEDFRPDLVLLDLVMPEAEVDGFALLARLQHSAVPVVVLSGLGVGLGEALRNRVLLVLEKPVSATTLRNEIGRIASSLPAGA